MCIIWARMRSAVHFFEWGVLLNAHSYLHENNSPVNTFFMGDLQVQEDWGKINSLPFLSAESILLFFSTGSQQEIRTVVEQAALETTVAKGAFSRKRVMMISTIDCLRNAYFCWNYWLRLLACCHLFHVKSGMWGPAPCSLPPFFARISLTNNSS